MRLKMTNPDDELRDALESANLPTLLAVMSQLSGDDKWISAPYLPAAVPPELFADDSGGFDELMAAEIRAQGFDLLRPFIDQVVDLPPIPPLEQLNKMMGVSVGEPLSMEYTTMYMEEMGFVNRDVEWREKPTATSLDNFLVTIIGAGMSGLCAAIKLEQAGIPYRIIEKNKEVGGTWYENQYPACGVDTPNYFYAYSFDKNADWSGYFSKQQELFEYFDSCADKFSLREHISFNTEVLSSVYDVDNHIWVITTRDKDGNEERFSSDALISAVGQLNRPKKPDIPGRDSFKGPMFHSARWQYEHDLTGKRVAVIGTGCSAVQFLPDTADKADQVFVFQRTPNWLLPNPDYYRDVEEGLKWLLNHVPYYQSWNRFRAVRLFGDVTWPAVVGDPAWNHRDRSMNEASDLMREALTDHIKEALGERQDLVEKVVPTFPVWGKRLIVDNDWFPTIGRENVELVTESIQEINETGIVLADGTQREVDVIIFATGFESNRFLWPMEIKGRSGKSLEDLWGDDPRAYLGITVPDYPNLFCLYGPNTNIVHGGSIIYQVECQVRFIMSCIFELIQTDIRSIECKDDVNVEYNKEVQELSENLAWGHPDVDSWYKNSKGRVVNNSPFCFQEYWERTHDPDFSNFIITR
ncbi:MAG TPA: NAD(P)/FAD-dependent oxidoreductase [Gammaproteobacteria bacterium]|nr:NAD(P)/FAD-dependent oxidoreductase [Gammaproteobacteria bacterium]